MHLNRDGEEPTKTMGTPNRAMNVVGYVRNSLRLYVKHGIQCADLREAQSLRLL